MVTASSAIAALSLDLPAAMPIYEYRCENGHTFEVMQRMTDDPVDKCEVCGAPVQRVFHPVAVHFKGSGFYNTDYGTKKRARELKDSAESGVAKTDAKAADKAKERKDKPKDSSGSGSESKAKKPSGS
jgi:putative FmdB family regulatory protein